MPVEIARLKNDQQRAMATAADRFMGRPDARTSVEEIDSYLKANEALTDRPSYEWLYLRATVHLLETDARLTPARRAELLRIAIACGQDPRGSEDARIKQEGIVDAGEVALVERLIRIYRTELRALPLELTRAIDDVAADGVVTDADRRHLTDASRGVGEPDVPQADEVVAAHAVVFAQRRAAIFRAVYSDAVQAGLVPGVTPSAALEPPSAAATKAVRDGSLMRELVARPREHAQKLLASVDRSWPRFGPDLERLAEKLAATWDTSPGSPTSSARVLAALLPLDRERSRLLLADGSARASLAAAVVRRLSDAQLAALDAPLAARLAAALGGGGYVNVDVSNIEGAVDDYVLPRAAAELRTFKLYGGRGEIRTEPLARLRQATAARFAWTPGDRDYYAPALGTLVERSQ